MEKSFILLQQEVEAKKAVIDDSSTFMIIISVLEMEVTAAALLMNATQSFFMTEKTQYNHLLHIQQKVDSLVG